MPMTVIGTDGGLLGEPVRRDYVTLGPAERVEVWADFREEAVGSEVKLQSLAFSSVEAGMMIRWDAYAYNDGHNCGTAQRRTIRCTDGAGSPEEAETLTLHRVDAH
ncbi:MAG: hypothetical protein R2867_28125 [Caldilineaceae bacterium]